MRVCLIRDVSSFARRARCFALVRILQIALAIMESAFAERVAVQHVEFSHSLLLHLAVATLSPLGVR